MFVWVADRPRPLGFSERDRERETERETERERGREREMERASERRVETVTLLPVCIYHCVEDHTRLVIQHSTVQGKLWSHI